MRLIMLILINAVVDCIKSLECIFVGSIMYSIVYNGKVPKISLKFAKIEIVIHS